MAEYRYLLYNLVTNTPITELPLNGVSFTQQLNSPGTLSANLLITDAAENALDVISGTQPNRTALYVERSDLANNVQRELVWGGMIWGREYNSTSQTISIQVREFESYLEKIFIDTRYMGIGSPAPDVARFVNIDLFQAVQLLMNVANTIGDVPIAVAGGSSGVTVSPTYSNKDYKSVYQGILDLSQGANGFDFNVDVYYDGTGTPQKVMYLGYPRIGYVYSSTDVNAPTLQMPGNILDYSYFEDGTLMATDVFVNGGGTAASVAISAPPGYPTYQLAVSYSDITNVNLLTGIADGRLAAVINPPTTLKITQVASQEPTVGRVAPGDDVRVSIRDARFPTGLNAVYRVSTLTITPNESGGPEQITYALTQPTNIYS